MSSSSSSPPPSSSSSSLSSDSTSSSTNFSSFPLLHSNQNDSEVMGKFAEWACDDSLSKAVRNYVQSEMQRLASDASSSGCNKKRRRYIERNREDADRRLYNDYFSDNPTYNSDLFRLRFRMRRELFLRIVHGVKNYDPYFQQKQDGTGRRGLSTLQKCTAAMRMLAYGVAADAVDEYLRIGETTTLKCMRRFVRAVIKVFGEEYMRRPNVADMPNY